MYTVPFRRAIWVFSFLAGATLISAQGDMRGHWTGSLDTPAGSLAFEVDLDKAAGGWIGAISIPAQNASGIPLEAISLSDGKASFRVKGAPGSPTFTGTLSADGKTLDGQFAQGPAGLPLKLTRTGEPKIEVTKPSPPVAAEFAGKWEGTIEGPNLRIVLTISNKPAGAEALFVSQDQGNAEIPVSSIIQEGKKLKLEVKMAGGLYEGELNPDGNQLTGTWTQLGNAFALNLKKAAAPTTKP